MREAAFVDNTLLDIHGERRPVGTKIIDATLINDPRFSDGDWDKFSHTEISRSRSGGSIYITRFELNIHYMYNRQTGATAQVKITNTYESGCVGVVRVGQTQVDPEYQYYWDGVVTGAWIWDSCYYCVGGGFSYLVSSVQISGRRSGSGGSLIER
jgi:hypothetical protein